ncbi:MAG TPA: acyltransferase domain-containing protein, partial [Pseudonocardiaceae bacterium]
MPAGPLVFAFTGQGVDCTGMALGLADRYPPLRDVLDECDAYYREHWGTGLLDAMLAPRHEWTTELVQPALFALQVGLARLLEHAGVRPDAVLGHSAGEYAALCVAGALSVTDGLHLAAARGSLLQRTAPGAMLAVFAGRDAVREALGDLAGVEFAVRNGPAHHVLAGTVDAIAEAEDAVHHAGLDARRLPGDRAFHSALVEPVLDDLARHAATPDWRPLRLPLASNLGGRLLEPGTVLGPEHVHRQTREPADHHGAVDALVEAGHDTFVELGPEAVLSRLGRAWPGTTWIPLRRRPGAEPVVGALGALYARGVDVDWPALAPGGRRIPLPTYPFQPRRHWVDGRHRADDRSWADDRPRTEGQPDMPEADTPTGAPAAGAPPTAAPPPDAVPGPATAPPDATAPGPSLADTVCGRVRELTARHLGEDLDRVTAERDFLDLGADSLLIINLLRELQAIFGVRVPMRELFEQADTPARLGALIAGRMDPARAAQLTGATRATAPVPT